MKYFKVIADYFLFRRMMSPFLLQIMFWASAFGVVYFGWWLVEKEFETGWIVMVLGVVAVRIFFELGVIMFRIYERLGVLCENRNND